mmetsp:Transcript_19318/g.37594  ORF Transcript_19318/g.37594 Transcript_19318/m.37594 type:complete len:269 (-) Transcript_19318:507-1313(-)
MPSLLVSTISAADALTGTHSATRETTAPVRRSTSVAETRLVIFNPCCCRCASSATASSTRKPSSQASRSISRPLFWPRRWANVNVEHGRGAQHAGRKHTKCAHRKREERRVHDAIVPAAGVSARASVQSVRAAAATAAAAVRLSAVEARQLLFKFAPALTAHCEELCRAEQHDHAPVRVVGQPARHRLRRAGDRPQRRVAAHVAAAEHAAPLHHQRGRRKRAVQCDAQRSYELHKATALPFPRRARPALDVQSLLAVNLVADLPRCCY